MIRAGHPTGAVVIGLDIGGANLKLASSDGQARVRPFALWKQPERLAAELTDMLAAFDHVRALAVTMTGELCDCFGNRTEGVQSILNAVVAAAGNHHLHFWSADGEFVSPATAWQSPLAVASANWLALAVFVGRFMPEGKAILIDIGSTTTDLVVLRDGIPQPRGRTDCARLLSGELLYLGATRTPIFALMPRFEIDGRHVPLIPEWFATARDVYLILGDLPEESDDRNTADGRPATRRCSLARVARHLGADLDQIEETHLVRLCESVRQVQVETLADAIASVHRQPCPVVCSGSGEFLARAALQRLGWQVPIISLSERLGPQLSTAGPAYAVAVLASEGGK
jgi:hypothetical protein